LRLGVAIAVVRQENRGVSGDLMEASYTVSEIDLDGHFVVIDGPVFVLALQT
jgi:hypothetical protein